MSFQSQNRLAGKNPHPSRFWAIQFKLDSHKVPQINTECEDYADTCSGFGQISSAVAWLVGMRRQYATYRWMKFKNYPSKPMPSTKPINLYLPVALGAIAIGAFMVATGSGTKREHGTRSSDSQSEISELKIAMEIALANGNYRQVNSLSNQILNREDDGFAFYAKSLVHQSARDLENSIAFCDFAIKKNASSELYMAHRMSLLCVMDKHDEAADCGYRWASDHSASATFLGQLAILLETHGDPVRCDQIFRDAINADSSNGWLQLRYANFLFAQKNGKLHPTTSPIKQARVALKVAERFGDVELGEKARQFIALAASRTSDLELAADGE